jgi:chromosomal replication initiation ATPase DnaA
MGTFVQSVHNSLINSSTGGLVSEATIRVTQEIEDNFSDGCDSDQSMIRRTRCPARVCRQYKISVGELCSGSRRLYVVQARTALSWIAVRELGYSGAEVARYLGVTNSCVTRIVASDTKPPVEELIKEL